MIVRSKRPERYTVLDNDILRNHALSFKARGILAYILSQPDNWAISSTRLAKVGPDGRDAIRTGLKELEERGYIVRQRMQDPMTGKWSTCNVVYDEPVDEPVRSRWITTLAEDGLSDVGKPVPIRSTTLRSTKEKTGDIVTSQKPKLCKTCNGAGWTAYGNDVERCGCNPKIEEL